MKKTKIIRIVDLFSGLHSWTSYFRPRSIPGVEIRIFSIDNNEEYSHNTSHIGSVLDLDPGVIIEHLGGYPDLFFASPPCTTFSVASIGYHWTGGFKGYVPKTEAAIEGMALLDATLDILDELLVWNPLMVYFVENPRGMMRMQPRLKQYPRRTVWYCRYGETQGVKRAKPTDIWSNSPNWISRPECSNGNPDCDHVRSPRGATTGTQSLKGNANRSLIPVELTDEIGASFVYYWLHGESAKTWGTLV